MNYNALNMVTSQSHELQCPEHEEPNFSLEKGWKVYPLIRYEDFWIGLQFLPAALAFRQHFKALKDDIILVTTPKSGTTWLKALVFSIVNRTRYDFHNHPLLTTPPHDLVPFLVFELYANNPNPDLTGLPTPRILGTHFPYQLLPKSITDSDCRVVYLCRNPKDTFVSMWHFFNMMRPEDVTPIIIEEAFDLFCRGISAGGPFWDHVLGYWKASLESPEKFLFLKYEELKEDPTFHLRRLAKFFGCPFSVQEEKEGVVEKILGLCSFDNMKNLEVNKSNKIRIGIEGKHFFRRGVVGDWKNYLTTQMTERLDQLIQQKLEGSGLSFKES